MGTASRRDSVRTILWGMTWIAGACWLWGGIIGNPLDELALIRRARIAPGRIVHTWEDVDDSDDGRTLWSHGVTYTYRLPDGRELRQDSPYAPGRLRDEFRDLQEPYPVEVEYLPEDPRVNRIKGDGSESLWELFWRELILGGFLLAAFSAPGVVLVRDGLRKLLQRPHHDRPLPRVR